MPTATQKAMDAARSQEFQSRIQLVLMRTALAALDDDNSARASYARRVIRNEINLFMAAVAVVANVSIGASIMAEDPVTESFGVSDDDIAFAVAEGGDPAVGVFHRLAVANEI